MTEKQCACHDKHQQRDKLEALNQIIDEYKGQPGALIPVLHKAQQIYGYLPKEVQYHISQGLMVPLAEVYGVVSFYALFTMTPRAEHTISVCLGTACYVKGAGELVGKIGQDIGIKVGEVSEDGKFGLEATRCIGACGLAPVLTVNEEVHGKISAEELGELLKKYQ